MAEGCKEIRFVESSTRYAKDGSPRAMTDYIFETDGVTIGVPVTIAAIRTIDKQAQLTPEEVRLAARTWLEIQISDGRNVLVEGSQELDANNMVVVADKLGWRKRFRSN